MFLQSQKKKSSIKPKAPEKKKKVKSKIKIKKPVPEEQVQIPTQPVEIVKEEIPPPKQEPVQEKIKEIPIFQPEPVMNIEDPPKQESEKEISRIRKDKRFNQRQGAKFGYNFNDDIDESDGPQLFVYEEKQKPSNDTQMRYAATEYKPPKSNQNNSGNDFFPKKFHGTPKTQEIDHPNKTKYNNNNDGPFQSGGIFAGFQKKENPKINSEISPMKTSNKGRRRVNIFDDNDENPKASISSKFSVKKPKVSDPENKILEESNHMLNKDGTINFEYYSKKSNYKHSSIQNDDNHLNKLLTNQNSEEQNKNLNFYYGKTYNINQIPETKEENVKPIRKSHQNSQNILSGFIKDGNPGLLIKDGSNLKLNSFKNNSYQSKRNNRAYNDDKNETEMNKNSTNNYYNPSNYDQKKKPSESNSVIC